MPLLLLDCQFTARREVVDPVAHLGFQDLVRLKSCLLYTSYESIYHEWAPNEKVATEVAYGAAIAGVRAVAAMKHVGLNVAADPLFTAAYNGVGRGFVIISADDPSMHSSQNEQDNRHYAKAAKIPMFEPSDSQECLDMMREAFDVSERFDIPVLFRMTTRVSHSRSLVDFGEPLKLEAFHYNRNTKKYIASPANAMVHRVESVSYTHLDVYKRQGLSISLSIFTRSKGECPIT